LNTVVTCGREPTVSRKEPSEGPVDRFYGRPDLFVDFPGNFGRITGKEIRAGTASFASKRKIRTTHPTD